MRFVAISDTHLFHDQLEIPDGDVLIHAGDMTGLGDIPEISRVCKWLIYQPHKTKIVVAGNHDCLFQKMPSLARAMVQETGAIYLEDQETEVNGIRIYGSPWQPFYGNWAFNLRSKAELKKKWDMIPKGIDVLITHGPPKDILDLAPGHRHAGCEELRRKVFRVKPKVHVFGHLHGGYGRLEQDGITFINASICTDDYEPTNKPQVFDL